MSGCGLHYPYTIRISLTESITKSGFSRDQENVFGCSATRLNIGSDIGWYGGSRARGRRPIQLAFHAYSQRHRQWLMVCACTVSGSYGGSYGGSFVPLYTRGSGSGSYSGS